MNIVQFRFAFQYYQYKVNVIIEIIGGGDLHQNKRDQIEENENYETRNANCSKAFFQHILFLMF